MPELPALNYEAPVFGMNSRDDLKDLKKGEVVQLTNARPGNPPEPIRGSRHHKISDTVDYKYASHAVSFTTPGGTSYGIVWVKDGTDYKLVKINLTTWVLTLLGTATGLTDPAFRFIRIWQYIYAIVDKDMTWDGSSQTSRHKIIEIGDDEDTVREMCIGLAAGITNITNVTGTTFGRGYLGYTFTFIRLTDDSAFDADGDPVHVTTFLPGVNEGIEATTNRKIIGSGCPFGVDITIYDADLEATNDLARELGVTHIRIHRTRLQTSSALAAGATLFYCMDIPLVDALTEKDIYNIELDGSYVIVETTTPHNLVDDNYVLLEDLEDGATEIDGISALITVLSRKRFQMNDFGTSGISAHVSGGKIVPSTHILKISDTVSDASLAGEESQMIMTTYSAGPKAGFAEYALNRLWLFGLLDLEVGRAYYSESPGGAGGTPTDLALEYPQKFASMFHYNYYVDMSVKKGNRPTGIMRLGGDIYFFFEGEIHALFGSDPTYAKPTQITDELGCAFPDTLIRADSENLDGEFIFFLGNNGPAITKKGGETVLLTEWKIAELWPTKSRELFGDLKSNREHIIHHCAAEFWKNTIWLSYETNAGVKRLFAYYFNPRLRKEPQTAPHGAYEVVLASV